MKRSQQLLALATFLVIDVTLAEDIKCGLNLPCPHGYFCKQDMGQCADDSWKDPWEGTCQLVTARCTRIYRPVCGCDSKSYSNECMAGARMVNVRHERDCVEDMAERRPEPTAKNTFSKTSKQNVDAMEKIEKVEKVEQACGGDENGGSSCGVGEYCHRPTGSCDGPGVCREKPMICTMDYTPHCGCDRKTYSNRCDADSNGMSVLFEGKCHSIPVQPAHEGVKLSPVHEQPDSAGSQQCIPPFLFYVATLLLPLLGLTY